MLAQETEAGFPVPSFPVPYSIIQQVLEDHCVPGTVTMPATRHPVSFNCPTQQP